MDLDRVTVKVLELLSHVRMTCMTGKGMDSDVRAALDELMETSKDFRIACLKTEKCPMQFCLFALSFRETTSASSFF